MSCCHAVIELLKREFSEGVTRLNTLWTEPGFSSRLNDERTFPSYKYLCCQVACVWADHSQRLKPLLPLLHEALSPGCVQVALGAPILAPLPRFSAQLPLSLMCRGLWTCLLNTSSWDFTAFGLVLGREGDEFTVELCCCL